MDDLLISLKQKTQVQNHEYKQDLILKISYYFKQKKAGDISNEEKEIIYDELQAIGKEIQFEYLINSLLNESNKKRIAALELILILLDNNKENQYLFLKETNIVPIGNIVILNWFPKTLLKLFDNKIPIKYINDIQMKSSTHYLENSLFERNITSSTSGVNNNSNNFNNGSSNSNYYSNLNSMFWLWPPNYKTYKETNIPDPDNYVVGIYLVDVNVENSDEPLFKAYNKEDVDYDYLISRIEDKEKMEHKKRISVNINHGKEVGKDDEKKKKSIK